METYTIRIFRHNAFEPAELRLIEEGISIANVNKSILIGYKDIIEIVYDKELFLHIIYKRELPGSLYYADERIEAKQEIINLISNKTKISAKTISEKSRGLENIIAKGECQIASDREGKSLFLLTQKRIVLLNEETKHQEIINLSEIVSFEKKGQTALKLEYGINKTEELFYNKIDELITNILKFKVIGTTYEDNMNLKEEKMENTKKSYFKPLILSLIVLIIFLILFIILNL